MSRPHPFASRAVVPAPAPSPRRMRPHLRPVPFPATALCCAAAVTTTSALMGRGRSLWFDEQYSLILASKPVPELIRLTAVDAHPPLYYLLLKSWMPLARGNIDVLRAFNCLLLGAAVLTMLIMLRDLFGERVAYLCMPLLACGGFMLRYGYELRMYAAAMVLVVAGTHALLHATGVIGNRRTTPGWWTAYALIVALGMLTLYLTAFVWLTHAAWLTVRSARWQRAMARRAVADATGRGWRKRRIWRWTLAYVASILLFLPWMPTAAGQVLGPSVLPPVRRRMNMSGVVDAFDTMLLGMTEAELPSPASLLVGTIVLAAAGALVAAYAAYACTPWPTDGKDGKGQMSRTNRANRMSATALIVMLSAAPTVLLVLWSAVRETTHGGLGMFSVRYLSMTSPFLYATLGISFVASATSPDGGGPAPASSPAVRRRNAVLRRIARIGYAATLVTLLAGVIVFGARGNHSFDRGDTPGSAALSRRVECSETHPVVAQDEYTYIDAYWYYRDCPAYRFLDAADVPARGGYAPLRGSAAQLRDIDDLGTDRFTLLSWSTTRDYDRLLGSPDWRREQVVVSDANAAVTYRRR